MSSSGEIVGVKRMNPYYYFDENDNKRHKTNEEYYDYDFYPDGSMRNRCLECFEDMGPHNPRQLCGKTICYNKDYDAEKY